MLTYGVCSLLCVLCLWYVECRLHPLLSGFGPHSLPLAFLRRFWMPAALPNVDLKGLGPTPEELAAARKILDDAKAASLGKKVGGDKVLRSRMASMTAYLKQYPDELVGESRGKQRQHYLLNFMVLQMRNSKAKKTTENIESSSHETKKMTDVNWWSSENGC